MNEFWNLDPIYKGFDDPAFEEDLAALKEKVAAFAAFTNALAEADPADALRSGIAQEEQIESRRSGGSARRIRVENTSPIFSLFPILMPRFPTCGSFIWMQSRRRTSLGLLSVHGRTV